MSFLILSFLVFVVSVLCNVTTIRVIPLLCLEFPTVHFIIGGDGPKKLLLEEMLERHQLHDRVELLGAVPHDRVRDVSITDFVIE